MIDSRVSKWVLLGGLLGALSASPGCKTSDGSEQPTPEANAQGSMPASTTLQGGRPSNAPRFVTVAPNGPVEPLIADVLAKNKDKTVLVYAGASWCEPCQRFHHAVEEGKLDSRLQGFAFIQFDMEADRDRIIEAGYKSVYIPLFYVPLPDGHASAKHIEGSITGEGSPNEITPRLLALVGK